MAEALGNVLAEAAALFVAQVVFYFAAGWAIDRLGRALLPHRKIQPARPGRYDRRDLLQAFPALAFVSFMMAAGNGLQAGGIGFAPAPLGLASAAWQLPLSLVLYDTWFYWTHRLLHTRWLYARSHAWHHRTVTPTVWTTHSETLLDLALLQSYWLCAGFLLPIGPGVKALHKLWELTTALMGHSGYEFGGRLSAWPSPFISVVAHDQHHELFTWNYATHFSVWDRLMGTLHPDHDRRLAELVGGG